MEQKTITITIKRTPRAKRILVLFIVTVFIVGAVFGTAIGLIIGASTKTASAVTDIPQKTSIETKPPISTTEKITTTTTTSTTPTIEYYDCPLSQGLQDYIRVLCNQYEIPMTVVIAMIDVESSFQPDIISDTNDYGLMQVNKINHEELTEKYGVTDFLDPYANVYCGITILTKHIKKYGDLDKALMAYNLGATGASRRWDKGIYTTSYTEKVRTAMAKYEGV